MNTKRKSPRDFDQLISSIKLSEPWQGQLYAITLAIFDKGIFTKQEFMLCFRKNLNKKVQIFIQVNLANEVQKSGVKTDELLDLLEFCKLSSLKVLGLMCLPPFDEDSDKYFYDLKSLNDKFDLKDLSMGMSHDYLKALKYKATFLRIGSKIFGNRN